MPQPAEVYLVRHGDTEWSLAGRHTGVTDLPLTENGRREARLLRPSLDAIEFALVVSSPMQRARSTCELAGLGRAMQVDADLMEWNYGEYEGLTTEEIRKISPAWSLFTDGCPGGESLEQVGARVDRLIGRIRATAGAVALFAHGHVLRVLAARWIGLPPGHGRHFFLDTATLSVLACYQDAPVLKRWNDRI
jgi:probable phosphoglycerate mutase